MQWNGGNAVSAELKRPLAKLKMRNRKAFGTGGEAVAVTYTDVPTQYDVLTGTASAPQTLTLAFPTTTAGSDIGRRRLPLRSVQRGTHRRPFGHGGKYDQDTRRTAAATELHVPRDGDVRMTDDRIRILSKSQNEVPQNKLQTVELHASPSENIGGGGVIRIKAQQTMKKLFLLAAGLALTLTACQKDEGVVSDTTSSSSFTVTIPQSGVQTRAVTDDFGAGTSVNRCILEIYRGDQLYNRIVEAA